MSDVFLVQLEMQDQQPQPISIHASFEGALAGAKGYGALETEESVQRDTMREWAFETPSGPTTLVCIYRLEMLP